MTARHFFLRSKEARPPCVCCPGGLHRFAGGLRIEPAMKDPYSGTHNLTLDGWLDLWVYRNARYEGRLVRITLEVLDDPAPVVMLPIEERDGAH